MVGCPGKAWIVWFLWEIGLLVVLLMPDRLAANNVTSLVHRSAVRQIRFSADGKWLAAATSSGKVIVWNVPAAGREWEVDVSGDPVCNVGFSLDSGMLAIANCRGEIIVLRLREGREPKRLTSFRFPRNYEGCRVELAFSKDGKLFASETSISRCGIRSWDLPSGRFTFRKRFDELAYGLAISDDPSGIWLSTLGGPLLVDCGTGHVQRRLERRLPGGCGPIELSPDGQHLATVSSDGVIVAAGHPVSIRLWDLKTGSELQTFTGNYGLSISFCRHSRLLAFPAARGAVELFDIRQSLFRRNEVHHGPGDVHLQFSPTEDILATCADQSPVVGLWRFAADGTCASGEATDWGQKGVTR